jgi:hypothetical protein
LDESAHACTRSELRGASCEDWKSALRMVKLTTEQRVFVVTTQTLTQSVTEVLNYLDECRTIKLNSQRYNDAQKCFLKPKGPGLFWGHPVKFTDAVKFACSYN